MAAMTPSSASRPLGHQPPQAIPSAKATSNAALSTPVCPPDTIRFISLIPYPYYLSPLFHVHCTSGNSNGQYGCLGMHALPQPQLLGRRCRLAAHEGVIPGRRPKEIELPGQHGVIGQEGVDHLPSRHVRRAKQRLPSVRVMAAICGIRKNARQSSVILRHHG